MWFVKYNWILFSSEWQNNVDWIHWKHMQLGMVANLGKIICETLSQRTCLVILAWSCHSSCMGGLGRKIKFQSHLRQNLGDSIWNITIARKSMDVAEGVECLPSKWEIHSSKLQYHSTYMYIYMCIYIYIYTCKICTQRC
jgi:hypothetical protein